MSLQVPKSENLNRSARNVGDKLENGSSLLLPEKEQERILAVEKTVAFVSLLRVLEDFFFFFFFFSFPWKTYLFGSNSLFRCSYCQYVCHI
jgi:hypothetical protein